MCLPLTIPTSIPLLPPCSVQYISLELPLVTACSFPSFLFRATRIISVCIYCTCNQKTYGTQHCNSLAEKRIIPEDLLKDGFALRPFWWAGETPLFWPTFPMWSKKRPCSVMVQVVFWKNGNHRRLEQELCVRRWETFWHHSYRELPRRNTQLKQIGPFHASSCSVTNPGTRHCEKQSQVQCIFDVSLLFCLAAALVINTLWSRTVTLS